MKKLILVLTLMVLWFTACTFPIGPNTTEDIDLTSIVMTLTAAPSSTPIQESSPGTSFQTATAVEPTATTVPTETATPIPSPTDTVSPPTATVVWSPAYPDQFIYYYYQHINARDYTTTWALLTYDFKAAVNPASSGGYNGYVAFWNTVQRVDILQVVITNQTTYTARVKVDMVYNYTNGVVAPIQQSFFLYYASSLGTWMFDSTSVTAPTYPYTPQQFIYYYYNNINARNYTLTWSLLTDSFVANNNGPSTGGYAGYVSFWDSVTRVDVNYVTVTSQGSGYANVTAGLTYNWTDGHVTSASLPFRLIYNSTLGNWQFNSP